MGKTLYLECYSGISGDMTVAALLDLGADPEVLKTAIKSLPVHGFEIKISRVSKSGLDACDFQVILDKAHENHDHDMEYLHGSHHTHSGHDNEHDSGHDNEHDSGHDHGEKHEHRNLNDILRIIAGAALTERAGKLAAGIFQVLAEAEAKAHGVPADQVHFHEVGAVDSIVDIVAAAVCLDNLDVTDVIVPQVYEGRGFVRCQHGMIPVPVPAVVNIAAAHGLQLRLTETEGELVTPTGAAIIAAVRTADKLPEQFTVSRIGLGAGKRTYDRPSILRAMLIETSRNDSDIIYKLETNIDDCTGEALGYTMDRLFEAGARDVHYVPVFMKKNRPAYQLNVIAAKELVPKLEQIIFEETTTIGIRRIPVERTVLKRQAVTVNTPLGAVMAKSCELPSGRRLYPEYESVAELAKKHCLPFQEVYRRTEAECLKSMETGERKNED